MKRDINQSNIKIIKEKPDLTSLENVSNGDLDFVKKMLAIFIHQARNSMDFINTNIEDKNSCPKIKNEAHRLLSPARHLQLLGLVAILEKIEVACSNDVEQQELKELTQHLDLQLNATLDQLNHIIKTRN